MTNLSFPLGVVALAAHRLGRILASILDYQYLIVGPGLEGDRAPPPVDKAER